MRRCVRTLKGRWRGLLKLSGFVLLVVSANVFSGQVVDALHLEIRPSNEDLVHRMTMMAAAAYALLIAVPFVPGVEIGLALIGMLGPAIVLLVYVSTLTGLLIAFVVGRFVSLRWLAELLESINRCRASGMLRTIEPMDLDERLAFIIANAPNRSIPFLLRHRYLALAIAVNVPGNIVIGGGGGISLMAGASRLYSLSGFLVTIALAVAPIPLAIVVFGPQFLTR